LKNEVENMEKEKRYYHLKGIYEGALLGVIGNFFVSSFFNVWDNQTFENGILCLVFVIIFSLTLLMIVKDVNKLKEKSK
jgi:uncharacterized membrane protein YeaQ/YmgE (transglycosylase-associated protein family)